MPQTPANASPAAKRRRTNASNNSNASNARNAQNAPRDLIYHHVIPRGQVYMLGREGLVKQPYDVHSLASMIDSALHGPPSEFGRLPPRDPHTMNVLSQATINNIMTKAAATGWTRPSYNNVEAAATARNMQREEEEEAMAAILLNKFQRWLRRVSGLVRLQRARHIPFDTHQIFDLVTTQSRLLTRRTPKLYSYVQFYGPYRLRLSFSGPELEMTFAVRVQLTPENGLVVDRIEIGDTSAETAAIIVEPGVPGHMFEWKKAYDWGHGSFAPAIPNVTLRDSRLGNALYFNRILRILGGRPLTVI